MHGAKLAVKTQGAGAAGSSAAYYLSEAFGCPEGGECDPSNITVKATVFDRNDTAGGRVQEINVPGLDEPMELGAAIYVDLNRNIVDLVKKFQLDTYKKDSAKMLHAKASKVADKLAIWNGTHFTFEQSSSSWWDSIRLAWRYGLSPWRVGSVRYFELQFSSGFNLWIQARSAANAVIERFMQSYSMDAPYTRMIDMIKSFNLEKEATTIAHDYFKERGVSDLFIGML